MRIDLHCHTKKCKQGDSPNRNTCPGSMISAMPLFKKIEKSTSWPVTWEAEM